MNSSKHESFLALLFTEPSQSMAGGSKVFTSTSFFMRMIRQMSGKQAV